MEILKMECYQLLIFMNHYLSIYVHIFQQIPLSKKLVEFYKIKFTKI